MDTPRGPVLQPVKGPLEVGDELVVRITLRSDRDMQYLHLKDHRGSYQTGFAEIQCMYAPEYSSHSESISLEAE